MMRARATLTAVLCLLPASAAGQAQFIPMGDPPGGATASEGLGVSADGSWVVGRGAVEEGGYAVGQAVRFDGVTLEVLGAFPGGPGTSTAWAASTDGSVVVGTSATAFVEAFRLEDGVMTGLGDLPGGVYGSYAVAVSDDGSVVVGVSFSDQGSEGFRWEEGVMIGLGFLDPANPFSQALGISANGEVVVGVSRTAAGSLAFRWQDGVMTPLGDLPGGQEHSVALDVSANGAVAVGLGLKTTPDEMEAVIFDIANGPQSLKDLLQDEFLIDLADWKLDSAWGISNDGRVITGRGTRISTQNPEGWMVVLPVACGDRIDNDGDGLADGDDPGCRDDLGLREDPQCQDGLDNDSDGKIDFDGGASLNGGVPLAPADPECAAGWQNQELGVGVPTLSWWGLATVGMLLPIATAWALRRRQAA